MGPRMYLITKTVAPLRYSALSNAILRQVCIYSVIRTFPNNNTHMGLQQSKNKESNTSRTILTFDASTSFTDSLVITRWDTPV